MDSADWQGKLSMWSKHVDSSAILMLLTIFNFFI